MPDIRYICLSDMHLGEEDSLLTDLKSDSAEIDPMSSSPVMKGLVECMRALISQNENNQKPTLILLGDILELALANTNEAAMVFERFIELILPDNEKKLFENIIYIPGNHDHHLWEIARETQYVSYLMTLSTGSYIEIPWHTTNLFEVKRELPESYFLANLIKRYAHLKEYKISIAYPNLGLCAENSNRCVIFHHGHFVEPIYMLMSHLKNKLFPNQPMPANIWDIEAENFAWIDFFWSTLGRSGVVGRDVEILYEKMQDPKAVKNIIKTLAVNLAEKQKVSQIKIKIMKAIIERFFGHDFFGILKPERKASQVLSPDAEKGLQGYMNGPVYEQIKNEGKQGESLDLTFVFGHTHKPFQEDIGFESYTNRINVYNSGGWVVETTEPEPLHGAAMILFDEEYNVASLRMYNEKERPERYSVEVKQAAHAGGMADPFYDRIKKLIEPDNDPWKDFSDTVADEVRIRAEYLKARIKK